MNISRVITFLVAGIVIGAILFFAGFGVLNLFNSSSDTPVEVSDKKEPSEATPSTVPVKPPTIQVTSSEPETTGSDVVPAMQGEGTSNSPFRIKPLGSHDADSSDNTAEVKKVMEFGTLTLRTVNSVSNEPVNADFLIENSDGIAITLVKDTPTSTLSLPVGDYKITVSFGSEKVVRFLGVKDGQNGTETFELDVPELIVEPSAPVVVDGDADVPVPSDGSDPLATNQTTTTSAEQNDLNSAATQQAEETDNTASQTTLVEDAPATDEAATPAATTTATETANSDSNSSQASRDDSTSKTAVTGGLRLSALTKQAKRPTTASFYIQRLNGQTIKTIRNVKTQQLTLPVGKYKVTAKTNDATVVKEVEILSTKGVHEIFLISERTNTGQQDTVQTNTNSQSNRDPERPTTSSSNSSTDNEDKKEPGRLELFAKKAVNNSPLKSNFYVQMPNGKMVASKVYVDSIGYKLPEGQYKVIVRATGYKNKSVMLNVRAGQIRREVFKLEATPSPQRPTPSAARPFGGLTVNIVATSDGSPLPADIVISQRDGTPLKQANRVTSASFDLPPREFLIRVTYGGLTSNHQVNIVAGKLAIKTISIDTRRMTRQGRQHLRR